MSVYLFDMSASQHSPPFVPFCIPDKVARLLLCFWWIPFWIWHFVAIILKAINWKFTSQTVQTLATCDLTRKTKCVQVFAGSSFLQRMFRSCFMSVLKLTRVRVDGAWIRYCSNTIYREQRKIRCLERELNSHFRVSRPPLYQLSYRANWDW